MSRYGFEYRYYQHIEYGERNLTLKTLNKLAKALGVQPSELLSASWSAQQPPGHRIGRLKEV